MSPVQSDLSTECPGCCTTAPIEDRFCEACGARLAPVADGGTKEGDRREVDAGNAAGVTNPGLVKPTNQDALFVRSTAGSVVAVVCDGVSSSVGADAAARVACTAAGRVLSERAAVDDPTGAMRAAIAVAQRAVSRLSWSPSLGLAAPACTFVAALWDGMRVTIGSVGDCRAYWVNDESASQLTDDDSWLREQLDAGVAEHDANADPRIHQITRWLGEDAPRETPAIDAFVPPYAGRLVLCSDGLWNYAAAVDDFAALVRTHGAATSPLTVARALVDHALSRGGHDNISVAVIDIATTPEGCTT